MESIIGALKDTPIPTILVIAGIVFLLLAIAGQLAGRIAVAPERQRWAALIGGGLLAIGLALHIVPQLKLRVTPPPVERVPTSEPFTPPAKELQPQPSDKSPSTKPATLTPALPVQASTEEKEPNDNIGSATLITEGTTIRGSVATPQDRDLFTFSASSPRTRVILRKQFHAGVDVYDHVEEMVVGAIELDDKTISLPFESTPGLTYYSRFAHFWTSSKHCPITR
jgi:hypothetical protein